LHLKLRHFLLLPAVLGTTATAQNTQLSGRILDPSGAIVPKAEVRVIDEDKGVERSTLSNSQGIYVVASLPPSQYRILVTAKGFRTTTRTGVTVEVGQNAVLDFTLEVGDAKEAVTVLGSSEPANLTDGSVSTVVDRRFVENLPLNGRSFQSLIQLTPGSVFVKVDTNPLAGGQFSIDGQRADANYFTVDGVSANYNTSTGFGSFSGQSSGGALPALTALGSTNSLVSIDALQEFRIQTSSYSPEYGRMPGGQVSLITRAGSNAFHGDAFEYFRNDVLDAKDWFANYNGLPKARERQNDFGGVLGGPVLKDKTFFFFSYEGLRLRQPVTGIESVPDLNFRKAVTVADPAEATLVNTFPLPNGPATAPNFAQFSNTISSPATLDTTSIRIDHSIANHLKLFGHYTHAPSYLGAFTTNFTNIRKNTFYNNAVTAGLTWIVSPTKTNEIRANYSQSRATALGQALQLGGAVVPPNSTTGLFDPPWNTSNYEVIFYAYDPATATSGAIQGAGFVLGTGNDNWNRQINLVDTFSWVLGAHQLKFGFDYRWISPILNRAGGNFADYFLDLSNPGNLYLAQLSRGGAETVPVFHNYSAYAQDTWKMTKRLTLTYGLRWDANPAPGVRGNTFPSVLEGLGTGGPVTLLPKGTPLYHSQWANFAPRIGAAYRLRETPGHETVIRAGFGTFYDTGAGVIAIPFDHIYPYFGSVVYNNVTFPLTPAQAPPVPGVNPPQQFWAADPHLKLPYTLQWNVAVQQSLGASQSLTVSYIGSAGRRLLRLSEYSAPIVGFSSPIPSYLQNNQSYSNYDALQAQFERRLSRRLQGLLSYTWSHSLDTSSGDDVSGLPPQYANLGIEYGPSDFDVRHVLTGALTFDIPGATSYGSAVRALTSGWAVDLTESFRTAFPINVTATTVFGNLSFSNHANLVPGVPEVLYGSQYPGGKEANPAAFVAAPANVLGNFPRNSLRGFDASQFDLALRRQFPLWSERLRLQFRVEFFNILNHPNFSDYGGAITTANWFLSQKTLATGLGGVNALYQMGGPRSGQASVKFLF